MDWLFKEDNYLPQNDKDAFVDKSILSVVSIISKIQRSNNYKVKGFIYEINPSLKLITTLGIIVMIALSRNIQFLFAVVTLNLIEIGLTEREDIKKILSLSFFVALFTFIILVPSIITGNIKNSFMIIVKVFCTVNFVNILSFTTKWHEITKSLKLIFIPDLFIFVLDTTIRYIYLLGEISLEMMYAFRLRSIGKNDNKYMTMSGIIGNLFLKSVEMGNEMYYAMECRGFTGEYYLKIDRKFNMKDFIYSILLIILISVFLILGGK